MASLESCLDDLLSRGRACFFRDEALATFGLKLPALAAAFHGAKPEMVGQMKSDTGFAKVAGVAQIAKDIGAKANPRALAKAAAAYENALAGPDHLSRPVRLVQCAGTAGQDSVRGGMASHKLLFK